MDIDMGILQKLYIVGFEDKDGNEFLL